MTRKKNVIMISMCAAILLMIIGYAAFASRLTIRGTSNITTLWQVEITNITSTPTGEAYNIEDPTFGGPTATFNAGFNKPGDKMTYTVTVKNTGDIDAIISDATVDVTGTPAIIYSIEDLQYGVKLASGKAMTFKVISEFDINATEIPSDTSKRITINIVAIQDAGQSVTPGTPGFDQEHMLVTTILNDNSEQADTNIDFSQPSSDTNGKGLYYTSTNTQDNKKVYYFRGAVENNYIEFGSQKVEGHCKVKDEYASLYGNIDLSDCEEEYISQEYVESGNGIRGVVCNNNGSYFYSTAMGCGGAGYEYIDGALEWSDEESLIWRIVRINEDGSIRLIASDVIGNSMYNEETQASNAYVGYMYGTPGATSYDKVHKNTNSSTIKLYLDNWFKTSSLINYSNYLVDAGFCNDRSLDVGTGNDSILYPDEYPFPEPSGYRSSMIGATYTQQFKCTNKNDLFTVSNGKGNKALDYPIGLITMDELVYAGAILDSSKNTNSYIYNNLSSNFWTMSPHDFGNFTFVTPSMINVIATGYVGRGGSTYTSMGVRPVINIKGDLEVISGDGTSGNPYKVKATTKNTLVSNILNNNTAYADNVASPYVTSSTGIDFSQPSSDTNGKGLYYTSANTQGDSTVYYFRGNVGNNYVKFGGHYWRIVRINEDGSIRLIYQGKSSATATGTSASIGVKPYNSLDNDNTYFGYMYGTPNSVSYESAHKNKNESVVKIHIDNWYVENLKDDYSSYLVDAGFCNDRSLAPSANLWTKSDTALGYGVKTTYYGAYNRLINLKQPQFECPNVSNDLFTVGQNKMGNKDLKYPIGLVTVDETVYAGAYYVVRNASNNYSGTSDFYMDIGKEFWTMSAGAYTSDHARIFDIGPGGAAWYNYLSIDDQRRVRPVINLKSDIEITSGNGTSSSPYVIKTN